MKQYNIKIVCYKCGRVFLKTKSTGNQCRNCRRRHLDAEGYQIKRSIFNDPENTEAVINFVNKIELQGGFLRDLTQLNDLLEAWHCLNVRSFEYDALNPGHQLHYMWQDLKKFKSRIKGDFN
jgi:hypothetical protein